jgi:hypothetical protein
MQVCLLILLHDLGSYIYVYRANYQYFSLILYERATYLFARYNCPYEYPNVRYVYSRAGNKEVKHETSLFALEYRKQVQNLTSSGWYFLSSIPNLR